MKTIWIGIAAVTFSIAVPAMVLKCSRKNQEKAGISAMDEIFIRCPEEIEIPLRSAYDEEVHSWAYDLTMEIVTSRGGKRFDLPLYKRLVLSDLVDRAASKRLKQAELALRLASSGIDISISNKWPEMAADIDPETEILFTQPLIQRIDEEGNIISTREASHPSTFKSHSSIDDEVENKDEIMSDDEAAASDEEPENAEKITDEKEPDNDDEEMLGFEDASEAQSASDEEFSSGGDAPSAEEKASSDKKIFDKESTEHEVLLNDDDKIAEEERPSGDEEITDNEETSEGEGTFKEEDEMTEEEMR